MGNLQIFQNLFQVSFPVEIADGVLGRMQALYGDGFEKVYGEKDPVELQTLACTVLNGLSVHEIERGLLRMNSEKWCPKLPEFRSWCIIGGDWWTAEQAWVKSLNFMNDRSKPITTLAKVSLDEIQIVLDQEGQKAGHRAFVAIYNDYLQRAKAHGRIQEMWKEPVALTENKQNENHKSIPCPPELKAQLKGINKNSAGRA